MADETTTIKELIDVVVKFEAERDWQQYHAPKNLAQGIAVETGELLEHFLWQSVEESRAVVQDADKLAEIKEEVADVFAYVLMLVHALGIDLSESFRAKMEKNGRKYPAEKYRGKYKLD